MAEFNFIEIGECHECGASVILNDESKIPNYEVWECKCGYPNSRGDLYPIYLIDLNVSKRLLMLDI